jgi:maltose-binding protein MalE
VRCSWRSPLRSWRWPRRAAATVRDPDTDLVHQPRQRRPGDLAQQCGEQSDRAYRIETQILPNEADAQREQLVRRLAAGDSSVDLMSLDPPFIAEFANAGYLQAITDPADVEQLTDGVLDAPLETAYWDDELVATPFWANTQLLGTARRSPPPPGSTRPRRSSPGTT